MSVQSAGPLAPPQPPSPNPPQSRFLRWHQRVLGFCLVIFAFELGLFLVVFPWLHSWELSWVPMHSPEFAPIWMNRYFRGALSGLGLLNIYIALAELLRQLRSMFRMN
jgi:hypothetical protein